MIENYSDKLNFPQHLSNLAKDFVFCCLRKNPFNRKNVYKLLQHPFITSNNHREVHDDVLMKQAYTGFDGRGEVKSEHKSERNNSTMGKFAKTSELKMSTKDNLHEINYSNYDQVVANFEKKGQKDKLIIELQKDLDEKTFAIEIRLKEKRKRSLKLSEGERTPESPILDQRRFFQQEVREPEAKDAPKRLDSEKVLEKTPVSNVAKHRLAMHERWKEREKTVELYGDAFKRDFRKPLGGKVWESKYSSKRI